MKYVRLGFGWVGLGMVGWVMVRIERRSGEVVGFGGGYG